MTDLMTPDLIDLVINQIKIDIDSGDVTALAELLEQLPENFLRNFLSEVKP
jgi:hypothetical protein